MLLHDTTALCMQTLMGNLLLRFSRQQALHLANSRTASKSTCSLSAIEASQEVARPEVEAFIHTLINQSKPIYIPPCVASIMK